MTSQIRSPIEYLIPTDNILLLFYTQIWLKSLALYIGGFSIRFDDNSWVA